MATTGATPISDIPWPKRTNKACCICRRDKIKCDGERPCAACLRRGLSGNKCIDGCPPCRRSRARCDGGDPCARCLEMGIDCSDEPTSPSLSIDESIQRSTATSTRSAPSARAKLACQACRRDNKKCDDNRPCMRCVSRVEECIHVDRIPKAVKHRCINCRKENKKCEDSRPCRHCLEMKLECIDAPRKGSGGTRVKMACANCRRNKVQCDPERPCRICVRRGLECMLPSCTCTETGSEPGTCNFCRSQRSKRISQTNSDTARTETSEERQSEVLDPPLSAASDFSGYNDHCNFQGVNAAQPQSCAQRHRIISQEQSFPTDIPMNADAFVRTTYMQNYPSQLDLSYQPQQVQNVLSGLSPSAGSFQYHARFDNQDYRQGMTMSLSTQVQSDCTHNGGNLNMTSSTTNDTGGLDKYLPSDLEMDTSAHVGDSSIQASFISQYQRASGSSYTQSGHGGVALSDFRNDVGVGIGTYALDGLASFAADPLRSYGPVPMAMPVSMTIPVPQTVQTCRDTAAQNAGQMDMHPQLRRGAYYLTSNSRTAQKADGS